MKKQNYLKMKVNLILLAIFFNAISGEIGVTEGLNDDDLQLSYETVARIASLPLHCYKVEYPYKLGQVLASDSDLKTPSELHPIFYGCFDWHSSVHGHWLLARALALYPDTELAENITSVFNAQFTSDKVSQELAYFQTKWGKSFERTYGWAWLLKLQEELDESEKKDGTPWATILRPLTSEIVSNWKDFLPKLVYPIRVGEHTNTAFGLSLAIDYTRNLDEDFENLIKHNSSLYYLTDKECPIGYEPSGYDFLSPCLQEVDIMVKVVEDDLQFNEWIRGFIPQLFDPDYVLEPGQVVDRTDGKLVHLDGVNFSRAWCLYNLARRLLTITGLEVDQTTATRLIEMGDTHIRTSIDNVVGSDYAGSHWLATFLMHALEKRENVVNELPIKN